jgi:hypothetical protein
MTLMPDRAVGGSSISDGRVEVMINRKTAGADYGGMGRAYDLKGEVTMEIDVHLDQLKSNWKG